MKPSTLRRLLSATVAASTILVVSGAVLALFFNPVWVGFEQRRSNTAAWTGFTDAQVEAVTGSIMSDLILGPPRFEVAVNGQPVLDPRERKHMVDVRDVLLKFAAVVALAVVALLALGRWSRGAAWFWGAVSAGGRLLAVAVVVIGVAFGLFFDAAFEIFHRIFFPAGSYAFDPGEERLVQLFPYAFWTETTVVIAVVGLGVAVAVAVVAGRMARAAARRPSPGLVFADRP